MIIEIWLSWFLLIVNWRQGKETSLPSRRTAETEKGAERLMEAIQLYKVPYSIISLRKLLKCLYYKPHLKPMRIHNIALIVHDLAFLDQLTPLNPDPKQKHWSLIWIYVV